MSGSSTDTNQALPEQSKFTACPLASCDDTLLLYMRDQMAFYTQNKQQQKTKDFYTKYKTQNTTAQKLEKILELDENTSESDA